MTERTLILAKPDAYARNLSGEILARFERKGLHPVALRVFTLTRELAELHYAEHAERPFFGELVEFITSGPLVAMVALVAVVVIVVILVFAAIGYAFGRLIL